MSAWLALIDPRTDVLLVVAIVFAVARIAGVKTKSFQAFAHLYVGGLAGAWLVGQSPCDAVLFWALCFVEVVCFLLGRLHPDADADANPPSPV
jgi:hypothetical protein